MTFRQKTHYEPYTWSPKDEDEEIIALRKLAMWLLERYNDIDDNERQMFQLQLECVRLQRLVDFYEDGYTSAASEESNEPNDECP